MSSHDEDLTRSQIEAANLRMVYEVFPDDVLTAMEQAIKYSKAISEQKLPVQLLESTVLPEPNP